MKVFHTVKRWFIDTFCFKCDNCGYTCFGNSAFDVFAKIIPMSRQERRIQRSLGLITTMCPECEIKEFYSKKQ